MLRKVKLYGELADFVGHKELDAVITCTADAIRFLVSNFPKLEAHMNKRYYKVIVNDDYEIDEESINNPTGQADISIVPVIVGSGGGVGKFLLGAALIGLSFGVGGFFAAPITLGGGIVGASFGAQLAFGVGVSLVLSGASDLLFPMPEIPDYQQPDDPRISFGFSGIQNVSRVGTTINICYGEIVCGSVVISAGIDTNQVLI
tara:strand:- start:107 stop:715 length:609 start_codon:yes stop_codon:yes gene_type:complete